MNSFKLAYFLFKNNIKLYFFYFTVLFCSIISYYNFVQIIYNPQIEKISSLISYIKIASIICRIIIIISIIYFMWYSNIFFLRLRKKETALYLLMGVNEKKVGKVFALESLILSIVGIVTGLLTGILISKTFTIMLLKVIKINLHINFFISYNALLETVIIFTTIITIFCIINYIVISKSELIKLLNSTKMESKISSNSIIKSWFAIILILISYIVILNLWNWKIDIVSVAPILVITVSIGIYIFFDSTLSTLLKYLLSNKKLVYKKNRLISFNNILFRLSYNSSSLSITTILASAAAITLSISISLYCYINKNFAIETPYSISYLSDNKQTTMQLFNLIRESNHEIINEISIPFSIATYNDVNSSYSEEVVIIKYSDFKKTIVSQSKFDDIIIKRGKPKGNNITQIVPSSLIGSTVSDIGHEIEINGVQFRIKDELRIPLLGNVSNLGQLYTLIVSDELYDSINNNSIMYLHGINITQQENSLKLIEEIKSNLNEVSSLSSYVEKYNSKYYLLGVIYFLGVIMSIIFIIGMFSSLYFKMITDAIEDRKQYLKLIIIGMDKKYVNITIIQQVGIMIVVPIIISCINTFIAMNIIEKMLYTNFSITTVLGITLFIFIMIIFYIAITKKYIHLINKN